MPEYRAMAYSVFAVLIGTGATHPSPGAPPVLGPKPTHCPASPGPVPTNPRYYGPGIGSSPVWYVGFNGPQATLDYGVYPHPLVYTKGLGWGHKSYLVIKPGFAGRITVSGGALRGHAPLHFDGVYAHNGGTTVVLDTRVLRRQYSPTYHQGWIDIVDDVSIPAAGCYYIQAHWRGGSWTRTFAAGQ